MNSLCTTTIFSLTMAALLPAQSGLDWRGHDVFPRYSYSGFAQDIQRNKVVRYGGWRGGVLSHETWEWDGRRWRQMHPKHSPPPLSSPILGYDAVTQRVILFGGINKASPLGFALAMSTQTWAWDGKDWTQLKPKNRPSARFSNGTGMLVDPKAKKLWMYGGRLPGVFISPPLEDFWEWDGRDWKLISSAAPPGKMEGFSVGYHSKSGKIVMFGGQRLKSIIFMVDATWTWDGKVWKKLGTSSSSWLRPSPRICGRMCESPADGSLLLHGGQSWDSLKSREIHHDDLWSFDGKQWKLLKASTGMPQHPKLRTKDLYRFGNEVQQIFKDRVGYGISEVRRWTGKNWDLLERLPEEPLRFASLAYDEARHEVIMLGGATPGAKPTLLQIYRLRNGRFQLVPVKISPPYDGGHQHVFDPVSRSILFFESTSANGATRVWSWNGSAWRILPYTGPSSPYVINVCYNPLTRTVFLSSYNSTWEWTGKGFRELAKSSSGPFHLRMTFDARRRRMVGFGMEKLTTSWIYDTWEWTGKAWTKMKPLVKTPQSKGAFIQYNPELGKVVLAGGARITRAAPSFDETWTYDGKTWSKLKVSPLPIRNNGPAGVMDALIYDPGQQRLLSLYHGIHIALRELSFRSLTLSQPLIRAGERTSFDIDLPKAAGQFFLLGLSLRRDPGIPLYEQKDIGTRLLPLALDPLLLWSFSGPILTQLDAKGRGSIPFALPRIQGLPELDLWAAGFTLDPKQSFRISSVSNRSLLQIVR